MGYCCQQGFYFTKIESRDYGLATERTQPVAETWDEWSGPLARLYSSYYTPWSAPALGFDPPASNRRCGERILSSRGTSEVV